MNKQEQNKPEKPSVFDTMKNSSREEDKAINRRTDAVNHSSLMKSIHNIKTN